MRRLFWAILLWLDIHVFRHNWTWLCNFAWDYELMRDGDLLVEKLAKRSSSDDFIEWLNGEDDGREI